MRASSVAATAYLFFAMTAFAAPVELDFPRMGSCHEGIAFGDGKTGVLVWGGGDEIRLTVGRSDLWDHRGGYSWMPEQNYTNIVAAVHSGDKDRLYGLFKKETPKGQPRNPYMLPLGRVVIKVPGKTLKRGTLDPFTGLGSLEFAEGGAVGLTMSKKNGGVFAMAFPKDVAFEVKTIPGSLRRRGQGLRWLQLEASCRSSGLARLAAGRGASDQADDIPARHWSRRHGVFTASPLCGHCHRVCRVLEGLLV